MEDSDRDDENVLVAGFPLTFSATWYPSSPGRRMSSRMRSSQVVRAVDVHRIDRGIIGELDEIDDPRRLGADLVEKLL